MKEKLKDRYVILAICFVLIGIAMSSRLAYIQIVKGEEYDYKSQKGLLREDQVKAPRGNILDRFGVPIAVNRMGFNVQIIKTGIKNGQLNTMLLEVTRIFEKNDETYNSTLSKYLTFNPIDFGKGLNQVKDKIGFFRAKTGFKFPGMGSQTSPREVFDYLRKEVFKIDNKYSDEEAYKIMVLRYQILGYTPVNPVVLATDVKKETVAEIDERHMELPGVTTEVEPMRKYNDAELAAHVVGYVRGIDSDTLAKKKDEGYAQDDAIGKSGIELSMEGYLRGTNGQKRVEVDTSGKLTQELGGNPALPGNDVVLTLDMKLQKVAMESLKSNIETIRSEKDDKTNFGDANAGSVVAMDVNTGEVLVMANYPSYDPSVFLESPENKEAQKQISDWVREDNRDAPTLNRAIQGLYPPGSTFKPLTAIAALEEGVITPETKIYDSGVYEVDKHKFYCMEFRKYGWSHQWENLTSALAVSCNVFFHDIGVRTGIEKMDKWAKMFGLGELTGIDIGGEMKGTRNNKEYKQDIKKAGSWFPADTAQAAIGQLYNNFTPLQLADYVSAIANGGKKFKPFLVKRVIKYDGSTVNETKPEYVQIPLKQETLQAVKSGMLAVSNATDGTAFEAFKDFPSGIQVASKTGTPETGLEVLGKSSNGVFVCYAPADNPKIAIAVVLEHGVWGANAAPIARDILVEYLGLNNQSNFDDKVKVDEAQFTR